MLVFHLLHSRKGWNEELHDKDDRMQEATCQLRSYLYTQIKNTHTYTLESAS